MLTPDQLAALRRLEAEATLPIGEWPSRGGNARLDCEAIYLAALRDAASDLLRAAEVAAACEKWGIGAVRGSDGRWGPRLRTLDEQESFWCSLPYDYDGYDTFADSVLAAAKWLEFEEH